MKYRKKPVIVDAVQMEDGWWEITYKGEGYSELISDRDFKMTYEKVDE